MEVENLQGERQRLFLGPAAGGLCLGEKPTQVQVVTSGSPLGAALLNKRIDDEFELNLQRRLEHFTIIDIQ